MAKARDKQVILNMASSFVSTGTGVIVFILLTPWMRIKLGEESLGVWYLILTLTGYLAIVHSSAGAGLTKYAAQYRAQNDIFNLRRVIVTGLWQYLFLGAAALVGAMVIYVLADQFAAIRNYSGESSVRTALLLVILNFAINVPLCGVRSIIDGFGRYDFNNVLNAVNILLQAVGIVAVLEAGYGLVGLAVCLLVLTGISGVVILWFFMRLSPGLSLLGDFNTEMMRTLFHYGKYSFIIAIGSMIFYQTDNVVLGAMFSGAMVTWYALGFKPLYQIITLNGAVIHALLPVASEISTLNGEARGQKIEELFTRGSRFSAIMTVPFFLFFFILGREFIALWQGPTYQNVSDTYWVFVILAIPHVLLVSQQIGSPLFFGLATIRVLAWQWLFTAAVNLVLSIILARRWGMFGAAWGTAVAVVISLIIFQIMYKKILGIALGRYYWNAWGRLILPAGLATAGMLGLKYYVHFTSLTALFAAAIATSLLFWVLSYRAMDAYERQVIRELFRKYFFRPLA